MQLLERLYRSLKKKGTKESFQQEDGLSENLQRKLLEIPETLREKYLTRVLYPVGMLNNIEDVFEDFLLTEFMRLKISSIYKFADIQVSVHESDQLFSPFDNPYDRLYVKGIIVELKRPDDVTTIQYLEPFVSIYSTAGKKVEVPSIVSVINANPDGVPNFKLDLKLSEKDNRTGLDVYHLNGIEIYNGISYREKHGTFTYSGFTLS